MATTNATLVAKLYFLARYKHDAPQHLVAGPFLDWSDACMARANHPERDRLVVVSTPDITFTEE